MRMTDSDIPGMKTTGPSVSDRVRRTYATALAALVAIGVVLSLPYSLQLAAMGQHYQQVGGWTLTSGVVLQTALVYLVILLGLTLAPAVRLGWPPLVGWHDGTPSARRAFGALGMATLLAAVAAFVLASALLMGGPTAAQLASPFAPWAVGLASVGGGIQEEKLFRLGAMTVVAWLLSRFRMGVTHPVALVWSANGVAALMFGWLFWRKGLIAAMTAHAIFDLVLKVRLPALHFFG